MKIEPSSNKVLAKNVKKQREKDEIVWQVREETMKLWKYQEKVRGEKIEIIVWVKVEYKFYRIKITFRDG